MAAGPYIVPNKARYNIGGPTGLLNGTAANYRLALVGSGWAPDNSDTGNEVWADVSANEIANGNGYTTGGAAVTATLSLSSGLKFTISAANWTASGGSIPAWRRAVLYYLGTLNGKVNPIVGHFLGDATGIDVPTASAGTPIAITAAAAGVLTI